MQLTTERLKLLPLTPSIIHELFNNKTKEEICNYLGLDDDGFDFYQSMHQKGMETFRISMHHFILVHKETNKAIGECGFHTWNPTHRRAEVFYKINQEEHKQKGYMTEALPAVLNYGFTHMNLHRVQALIDSSNTASLKLLQRFGFVYEGIARQDYVVNDTSEDSDCYSLLQTEWKFWG
jgi:[ribosomal protein S5]-alanine N-acetyltransferase